MARTPLMAGNWKMNLDHLQAIAFVQKLAWSLKDARHDFTAVEVAVFPPFTDLRSVQTLVAADKLPLAFGAQDGHKHDAQYMALAARICETCMAMYTRTRTGSRENSGFSTCMRPSRSIEFVMLHIWCFDSFVVSTPARSCPGSRYTVAPGMFASSRS